MISNRKKPLVLWLPVFFWAAAILTVSSIPGNRLPGPWFPGADKLMHAAEYAVLGFLIIRAVSGSGPAASQGLTKIVILSIIISSLFGAFDEWYQRFIFARKCDLVDLAADLIGACIGVFLYRKRA